MAAVNQNSHRPRLQFRLWMMLLLVFIAAIASVPLADWWNRPTGPLAVTLLADGSLRIDGAVITPVAVKDLLSKKRRQYDRYNAPLTLKVTADREVHSSRILELIETSRAAGFERFTLQASNVYQLRQFEAAASPPN